VNLPQVKFVNNLSISSGAGAGLQTDMSFKEGTVFFLSLPLTLFPLHFVTNIKIINILKRRITISNFRVIVIKTRLNLTHLTTKNMEILTQALPFLKPKVRVYYEQL
jgi:hypothetical protein